MSVSEINKLLKGIAGGDRQAFDCIFDYYYPRLLRFARRYVRTYENAEEVVMDVLVRLLKKKDSLHKIENFNSYLFLSVKNQSMNFLRKKKPDLIAHEDEEDYLIVDQTNPESIMLDQELMDLLQDTVESLPAKRRTVYKMIKEDGLRYSEVARLLNISPKTVEVHMGLAISSIRESIRNYMDDSPATGTVRKLLPISLTLAISHFFLL